MNVLLLDYNGVIVDDERLHLAAFREVLAGEGIRLEEATYFAEYLGCDDRAAFEKAFAGGGRAPEPEALHALLARKADRYAELAARALPVVPGVTAFVRAAARDALVAVVSGALRREIDDGLRTAGIRDAVGAIVAAEDVMAGKPDPSAFRLALARLAAAHPASAWRVAVVEDSLPGLQAARAIGAGCLMLTTSHPPAALEGADLVWETFEGHTPEELAPLYRPVKAVASR